jgi:DNA-binding transcriptional regulator GbsR (MarR family)
VDEFDREMVAYFTEMGRMQGMDESYLRIFAILYLEPEEITMEDLAEKTGYSMASVSNKVKLLEAAGAIQRSNKPGSKRAYLYMEKDFINIMRKQLILKQEMIIELAKERIPRLVSKYERKIKSDKDRQKLKIVEEYYRQVQKAEKIMPKIIDIINNQD